jgi:hypothetical protein
MTYPGNLPAATVVGTLRDEQARPLKSAEMTFSLQITRVVDPSSGDLFYKTTDPPTCTTDATTGEFTVELLPTNDPDESPINWVWHVAVSGMDNAAPPAAFTDAFDIVVPHDVGTVELAAVIQAGPANGTVSPVSFFQLADVDDSVPWTDGQIPGFDAATGKLTPGSGGSGLPAGGTNGQIVRKNPTTGTAEWETGTAAMFSAQAVGDPPSLHAATHGISGDDFVTPASIGAASAAAVALISGPQIFYVENYGAVGDGTTDDSAAINSCIAAAVTWAAAAAGYAEVRFQAKTYLVNTVTKGGAGTLGNAMINLPVVASTARKVTLCLKGAGNAAAYSHWLQTVPQAAGTVIKTTLTGLTPDGTYGDVSIIGGPGQNYNGGGVFNDFFSNMLVVIDGLDVQAPFNPSMVGMDFRQLASAQIISASCIANAAVVGSPSLTTAPTDSNGLGLAMPKATNNDISQIESYTCEGFYYGLSVSEHFNAQRIGFLYVNTGLYIRAGGAPLHGASILYMGCEAFRHAVVCDSSSSGSPQFPIFIGQLDCEAMVSGGDHISDNTGSFGGALIGEVHWAEYDLSVPTVVGAKQLRVINERQAFGAVTAPSVPATATPLQNPFWRDAAVYVAGTLTGIKVDGQALGITAGLVEVPTGKTIELDYSGTAPTWVWVLR